MIDTENTPPNSTLSVMNGRIVIEIFGAELTPEAAWVVIRDLYKLGPTALVMPPKPEPMTCGNEHCSDCPDDFDDQGEGIPVDYVPSIDGRVRALELELSEVKRERDDARWDREIWVSNCRRQANLIMEIWQALETNGNVAKGGDGDIVAVVKAVVKANAWMGGVLKRTEEAIQGYCDEF